MMRRILVAVGLLFALGGTVQAQANMDASPEELLALSHIEQGHFVK